MSLRFESEKSSYASDRVIREAHVTNRDIVTGRIEDDLRFIISPERWAVLMAIKRDPEAKKELLQFQGFPTIVTEGQWKGERYNKQMAPGLDLAKLWSQRDYSFQNEDVFLRTSPIVSQRITFEDLPRKARFYLTEERSEILRALEKYRNITHLRETIIKTWEKLDAAEIGVADKRERERMLQLSPIEELRPQIPTSAIRIITVKIAINEEVAETIDEGYKSLINAKNRVGSFFGRVAKAAKSTWNAITSNPQDIEELRQTHNIRSSLRRVAQGT